MTSFYSPLLYLPARVSGLTCEKNGYFLYWHLELKTNFCGIFQQSEIWIDKNSQVVFPLDFVIYFRFFFLNNWKNSAYFFGLNFSMEFRKQQLFAPIYVYTIHFFFSYFRFSNRRWFSHCSQSRKFCGFGHLFHVS